MKKYRNLIFWLAIGFYSLIALGFSSLQKNKVVCNNIQVIITDNTDNYFVERDDVISMFQSKGISLLGMPLRNINVDNLESILNNDPSIKSSQVYGKIDGNICIEVEQRNPIVRFINKKNESFYLDEQGKVMPLSQKYTAHVLIANGNINESKSFLASESIPSLPEQNFIGQRYISRDIYIIAKYIYSSKFWRSMFEQIYVNYKNEIELIPRVGQHIIIFGTSDDYVEKFNKLEALYKVGLKKTGWNKYTTINLKYQNQVVCTKK